MSKHSQIAYDLFKEGYNCSQAVLLAFAPDLNLDKDLALKLSSSFGGGMGRLREVCGAVSGMFMVLGLMYGYTDPKDHSSKTALYKTIQDLAAKFKERNGSIICKELLSGVNSGGNSPVPQIRTPEYYKKRPCQELVRDAAEILDEYIESIEEGR